MIYFGIVEDRIDPLKLGRCKVRIVGLHSPIRNELPTDDLPWAYPIQPITSAGISGVGHAPVGLVEGSWVCIIFKDADKQVPIILGSVGGIPSNGNKQVEYKKTNDYTVTPVDLIESYSPNVLDTIKSREMFIDTAVNVDDYFIVGYKSREVDDVPVMSGQVISKEKAEEQLKIDVDSIFYQLKSSIRSPITQSMIDALIIVAHGVGIDEFNKTTILPEINTNNYNQAAASILNAYSDKKDKKYRAIDKTLFLKDGLPTTDTAATNRDVFSVLFGDNAFMNPTGQYPLYLGEPDTNKLARHEDVGSTIVAFKEAARVKNVILGNGESFSQPNVPYNADYPFNKVFASESGHIMEFDDTPGSERVHLYHRSGTYNEVDCNGTQVNRVVGDKVDIVERNGTLYVRGAHNVVVEGSKTLKVSGVMDVQISGATNVSIYNDANINVSGNANLSVGESLKAKAQKIQFEADDFHIKSNGSLFLQGNEVSVKSSGDLFMQGSDAYMKGTRHTLKALDL